MVDLKKAFNRVDHSDVMKILYEMGVPGWTLKIVAGFLTKRKLNIWMNGKTSSTKDMPGGCHTTIVRLSSSLQCRT